MEKLSRDRIRQEIRKLLYQEQKSLARIAKDCGMDEKTVRLASEADMTERTQMRFSRYFDAVERNVRDFRIRENHSIKPTALSTTELSKQVRKMAWDIRGVFGHCPFSTKMDEMTYDEAALLFFRIEDYGKKMLLWKNADLITKTHMILWDKWDYYQWKEKIELARRDINR